MWKCGISATSECDWDVLKAHRKTGGSQQHHRRWQYGKQENNSHYCCMCTGSMQFWPPSCASWMACWESAKRRTRANWVTSPYALYLYCKAQCKDRWPELCTHLHSMDFIVQRSAGARRTSFLSSSLSNSLSPCLLLFFSFTLLLTRSVIRLLSRLRNLPSVTRLEFSHWL